MAGTYRKTIISQYSSRDTYLRRGSSEVLVEIIPRDGNC
jgi:hypothetical protein